MLNKGKNVKAEHFKKIFDNYFQSILYFALKYVNNDKEAAQDLVQESFIELWKSKIIDEDIERIKAFLYLTTRNKALNYLKHEKIKENYFIEKRYVIESERFFMNQLIEHETIHIVQNAINELPEQGRKVILLKLEGLKNQEIAQQIGISIDTVKYHRNNAFKTLRHKLKNKVYLLANALL